MDEDSSSSSPDDDSSILRENEANQHSLSDSNPNNANSQILTPNSSSTNSTASHQQHQMVMRQADTPPVSPGYHQLGQAQRATYLDSANGSGLHLFNQNSSSIWSPAGVNPNFNLTPNLISAAAAAAVANINTQAAGSVTPSSSTSPPSLLGFGATQSTSPSSLYPSATFGSLNTSSSVSSTSSSSSAELQPNTNYENYYSSSANYLSPYHSYAHQANPYRHLQPTDYMSPDYNAIQRSADMWAAHKFHGF